MIPTGTNLVALGVSQGTYMGQSYAYAIDESGVILEYDTSPVRAGQLPTSPIKPTTIASVGRAHHNIAAMFAAAANNKFYLGVYYIDSDGFLADFVKDMSVGKWLPGVLASKKFGAGEGKGLKYAFANDALIRVGFWGDDGNLYEAVCIASNLADPSQWSTVQVIAPPV